MFGRGFDGPGTGGGGPSTSGNGAGSGGSGAGAGGDGVGMGGKRSVTLVTSSYRLMLACSYRGRDDGREEEEGTPLKQRLFDLAPIFGIDT